MEPPRSSADEASRRAIQCPGCGHLYTGETARGWTMLGIAAAGGLLMLQGVWKYASPSVSLHCDAALSCQSDIDNGYKDMALGVVLSGAAWAYGVHDARASAERMTSRRSAVSAVVLPMWSSSASARGDGCFGVRLVMNAAF